MERSYGQLCSVARALDVVGQRWALLVIRNLLVGPMRYGELLDSLRGITTTVLALRLKELEAAGLIQRSRKYGIPEYELSTLGERFRGILFDLAEIGDALPRHPDQEGDYRTALLSLCRKIKPSFDGELELRIDDRRPIYLRALGGRLITKNVPETANFVALETSEAQFLARLFGKSKVELPFVGPVELKKKWRRVLAPPKSN